MRSLGPLILRHTPWLLAGLIILVNVLVLPAFRRVDFWLALGNDSAMRAALALALMPIIVTGGIDLSVGSVCVLVSVVMRRRTGRGVTPEEHLEQAALKAEADRNRTEQIYRADRYDIRD